LAEDKEPSRFALGKRSRDSVSPIDRYETAAEAKGNRNSSGKKDGDKRDLATSQVNQNGVGAVTRGGVGIRAVREDRFGSLRFDASKDYKQEYLRIYLANLTVLDRIKQCRDENESMKRKMVHPKVI
jgi:hypothetical protein